MKMICGFYNIRPYTPAPLAVITRCDSDAHYQILYPDGHLEELTDDEYKELEPEFVKTRQKNVWNLSAGETNFVLYPDGRIDTGSNSEVCHSLIQWYKEAGKELDGETKAITKKYISFLLEKLIEDGSELEHVKELKVMQSFTWFLKKMKNPELSLRFGQLEIQLLAHERIQKLREISLELKAPLAAVNVERITAGTVISVDNTGSGFIEEGQTKKKIAFYQPFASETGITVGDVVRYSLISVKGSELAVNLENVPHAAESRVSRFTPIKNNEGKIVIFPNNPLLVGKGKATKRKG